MAGQDPPREGVAGALTMLEPFTVPIPIVSMQVDSARISGPATVRRRFAMNAPLERIEAAQTPLWPRRLEESE